MALNEIADYVNALKGLTNKTLEVGIISKADDPVKDAPNLYEGGELTLGELALIHEFGLGNNPVRSIIQAPLESNEAQSIIEESLATELTWKQLGQGEAGEKKVLDRIGKRLVNLLANWYLSGGDGTWDDLSPEYERRKTKAGYSETPLNTTLQLGEAFEYRIS
jgi:hypothetical protein